MQSHNKELISKSMINETLILAQIFSVTMNGSLHIWVIVDKMTKSTYFFLVKTIEIF